MTMLKCCPFCGRQVRIYVHGYYGCPVIEHATRGCECVFQIITMPSFQLEKAAELWNRRAKDLMEDDLK